MLSSSACPRWKSTSLVIPTSMFYCFFPTKPEGNETRMGEGEFLCPVEGRAGALAVEPLIAALKDPVSNLRGNAAEALGRIADPRAARPLIAALKDREPYVVSSAATAFLAPSLVRLWYEARAEGGSCCYRTLSRAIAFPPL
jgi:hypothetical protein